MVPVWAEVSIALSPGASVVMVGAVVAGGGWFTPSAEGANRPRDWAESVKLANFGPEEMGCGLVFGPIMRTDGDEEN